MDLVLHNGKVMTLDPDLPDAQAVAIRDGRVAAVGDDAAILELAAPATRRVDVGGGMVLPGLTDAHGHVSNLGRRLSTIDLRGLASVDSIATRVRERALAAAADGDPDGDTDWITGGGWDQTLWPGAGFPDHRPLTAASPDRPVYLRRVDGHAGWANLRAMQVAGVTRATPDPEGGQILRDPRGEPTGVFIDRATGLVESREPKPSRARIKTWIRAALRRCAGAGLTGVHDAGVSPEQEAAYRELADEDALPLRVYLMWDGTTPEPIGPMLARDPYVDYRGRLTLRTVKLMVDGALGSRGALLFDDYSDAPGQSGLFVTAPEELERRVVLATRRGYQVATHAIGDRGAAVVLDIYEKVFAAIPATGARPRIEHLQCVRAEDIARVRRLGAIASMQPSHATSDMRWAEARVGAARARGLYAWRWVLDAGIPLAGGSDFPVDPETPLLGLHSAVTRQDANDWPPGGWHPEQRMTIEEAVRAYTAGAAWAAYEEREGGAIRPGARADLTVLSEDLRRVPPERIDEVRVSGAIVGGRVVHDAF